MARFLFFYGEQALFSFVVEEFSFGLLLVLVVKAWLRMRIRGVGGRGDVLQRSFCILICHP